MVDFRADLHCHSSCSDGSDEPLDLLQKAKNASLQGLSITDHDTIAAYTPELFALAEKLSIRILPGVEISSELEGVAVHVLGYGYNLQSSSFLSFLEEIRKRRSERNRAILKKLADKKMVIKESEFSQIPTKTIGRPHIAALLVKKGYVSSKNQAFDFFLKDGASCYVPGFNCKTIDAIEQIRLGGGKAILAHPHFYKSGADLKKILSCPFDGIECHYAHFPKEIEKRWIRLGKEKGWLITGGSDYHGTFSHNLLGSSWVNEEIFNGLLAQ